MEADAPVIEDVRRIGAVHLRGSHISFVVDDECNDSTTTE